MNEKRFSNGEPMRQPGEKEFISGDAELPSVGTPAGDADRSPKEEDRSEQ